MSRAFEAAMAPGISPTEVTRLDRNLTEAQQHLTAWP